MRTDENVLEIMAEKGVDSVAMGAALVVVGRTAIEASAGRINCPGAPSKKVSARPKTASTVPSISSLDCRVSLL